MMSRIEEKSLHVNPKFVHYFYPTTSSLILAQPCDPISHQHFFPPASLFPSSCGGTTSTPCCVVILLSDVAKCQLYHRALNCTSVVSPSSFYPVKYYTPYDMGMGELKGGDRTYFGQRSEGVE